MARRSSAGRMFYDSKWYLAYFRLTSAGELVAGKRDRSLFQEIPHPTRFSYRGWPWFRPVLGSTAPLKLGPASCEKGRMLRPTLTIACGLVLAACATLDEGDCRYADWFELGRRDGAQGHAWRQLVRHNESCREYGVAADEQRYRSGRDAGLRQYCTPDTGWRTGLRGASYRQVCPAELEGAFLDGYELGREVHKMGPEIARYKRETKRREDKLAKEELSAAERRELLHQIHELIEHRVAAERQLAHLEAAARERGFLR